MGKMRIHLGRHGMRGGKPDPFGGVVGGVDLSKSGGMNWAKLRREIEEAIEEVLNDSDTPGLVQRIEIQRDCERPHHQKG